MLQQIKDSIPLRQCMEHYGIKFNERGKCCCPFHKEKTPSLSLKGNHFKCFGCGAGGDIFDFMVMYFHISVYVAMKQLDNDFGLGLLDRELTPHQKRVIREQQRRRKSARLIEQAEKERKLKAYSEKCDQYREAMYFIEEHKPTDDGWTEAFNTFQYLEYWFERGGYEISRKG